MTIRYILGDATRPVGRGPKVIAHVCNTEGYWGKGFVKAITSRWYKPEARYRTWAEENNDQLPLGMVQPVRVEPDLWVLNMIAQEGIRPQDGVPPIRYEALRTCLGKAAGYAKEKGASIHMPRIGAGLAGGDWVVIEGIIQDELDDDGVAVVVYDLPHDTSW